MTKIRELETASYRFAEAFLTDVAEKDAMNKVFNRITGLWIQSASFLNAYTSRSLATPKLTLQVRQLIKNLMDEIADESLLKAHAKKRSSSGNQHSLAATTTFIYIQQQRLL